MSGIVSRVQTAFCRANLSFKHRLRFKGARRRDNWTPKLLRGRLYKGSGSGTHTRKLPAADQTTVGRLGNDHSRYVLIESKIREFVSPFTQEFTAQDFPLKPYVALNVPLMKPEDSKAPTCWDYLKEMEKAWNSQDEQVREESRRLWAKYGKKEKHGSLLTRPAGKLAQWGH